MTTDKYYKLFMQLYERTAAGSLSWQETVDKGTYIVSFSSYSVEISQISTEHDFEHDVVIRIRDSNGEFVESIADRDVGANLSGDARSNFYLQCEALYKMARRTALGADKALDSILTDLDNISPF